MARRKLLMIEVEEVLYRWLKGMSEREISRSSGIARMTVRKILLQAQSFGFHKGCQQEEISKIQSLLYNLRKETTSKSPCQEYLKNYHDQLADWIAQPHMTVTQMVRLLKEEKKPVSETSLRRYIRKHFPQDKKVTVHLNTLPGEQAQVDFACVGLMMDQISQKMRKAYAFIMTLSYSRHRFVRFVFSQDIKTWVDCHIRAFHFFGGVPKTIMPDNLKSGVQKADLYDPILNRVYGEFEKHYGFICDPTKVRTPEHKGKVERSVQIIRQQILAGRTFKDIEEANSYALHWCRYEISLRVTRTTGKTPWDLFIQEEKEALLALPLEDYSCPVWQKCKVHRDHHIVFEGSFYSVPSSYIGQEVWLRATERVVDIYMEHVKIKTHVRSKIRGQWITDIQDYPKGAKFFLEKDRDNCLRQAQEIGHSTYGFLNEILKTTSLTHRRKAQAILRLGEKYGPKRLEAACQRALSFDNFAYRSLKRILAQGLDNPSSGVEKERKVLDHEASYLRQPDEFYPLHQTGASL